MLLLIKRRSGMKKTLVFLAIMLTLTAFQLFAGGSNEVQTSGEVNPNVKTEGMPVYGDNLVWDGNVPVNGGRDVSLVVYAPSGTIGDYYVKWADKYMELRPNVHIDVQITTDDIGQKVILETMNGNPPDMF